MKNQAIVIRKYGRSSVLKLENTEIDQPGRNEILLRQTGIGVNYHDIYVRSGLYKTLDLPGIPMLLKLVDYRILYLRAKIVRMLDEFHG